MSELRRDGWVFLGHFEPKYLAICRKTWEQYRGAKVEDRYPEPGNGISAAQIARYGFRAMWVSEPEHDKWDEERKARGEVQP